MRHELCMIVLFAAECAVHLPNTRCDVLLRKVGAEVRRHQQAQRRLIRTGRWLGRRYASGSDAQVAQRCDGLLPGTGSFCVWRRWG